MSWRSPCSSTDPDCPPHPSREPGSYSSSRYSRSCPCSSSRSAWPPGRSSCNRTPRTAQPDTPSPPRCRSRRPRTDQPHSPRQPSHSTSPAPTAASYPVSSRWPYSSTDSDSPPRRSRGRDSCTPWTSRRSCPCRSYRPASPPGEVRASRPRAPLNDIAGHTDVVGRGAPRQINLTPRHSRRRQRPRLRRRRRVRRRRHSTRRIRVRTQIARRIRRANPVAIARPGADARVLVRRPRRRRHLREVRAARTRTPLNRVTRHPNVVRRSPPRQINLTPRHSRRTQRPRRRRRRRIRCRSAGRVRERTPDCPPRRSRGRGSCRPWRADARVLIGRPGRRRHLSEVAASGTLAPFDQVARSPPRCRSRRPRTDQPHSPRQPSHSTSPAPTAASYPV